MKDEEGFELDGRGDPILSDDFDFAVYFAEDFDRLRKIVTTDELKEACYELMVSKNISDEQMQQGLTIIRERFCELGPNAGLLA